MKVEKEKSGHYFMRREVNNTLKIKIVSVAANFYFEKDFFILFLA